MDAFRPVQNFSDCIQAVIRGQSVVQGPGSRVIVSDTVPLHFKLCFPPRLCFPLCFMRTWRDGFLQTSNASFLSVHFYALCSCDHVPGGSFEVDPRRPRCFLSCCLTWSLPWPRRSLQRFKRGWGVGHMTTFDPLV